MREAILSTAAAIMIGALPALADTPYYSGKTITFVVSAGSGGGYDTYARVLARYIGRHIPGSPNVVVQNMTGAGGLKATLYMNNNAARDGGVIALIQSTALMAPYLGTNAELHFDPLKFVWIGNMSQEFSLCASWHASPVKTVDDMLHREFIVGSSGAGTSMEAYPNVLNNTLGTHIKIISGYSGGAEVLLAMERGEVQGRCGASLATYRAVRPEWLSNKKINLLMQTSLEKDPAAGNTPWIMDYATTARQRDILRLALAPRHIQRPIVAPPGVPVERADELKAAYDATVADPEFIEEASQRRLDMSPMHGSDVRSFIETLSEVAPEIRNETARAFGKGD